MTDHVFYSWDGYDRVGRRAVLAIDHNGRQVLGAFQTLHDGRWVQEPTDVAHECVGITPEQARERTGCEDLHGPVTAYREGYKPGSAMRNPVAGHAYEVMAHATAEERELTLEEAGDIMRLFDALRERYDRAWADSLRGIEEQVRREDELSRAAANEFWSGAGGVSSPPDDETGDDDVRCWGRVVARVRRQA